MPGGRAIRKDGALRTLRHIDQEQPGRAVDAISPLVVEHQELRPFEMRDTVLPEERATHQPLQPTVVPVQDAERIQVPEGDHQVTRFDTGHAADVFPHLVDEVEMRRFAGKITMQQQTPVRRLDERVEHGDLFEQPPFPVDDVHEVEKGAITMQDPGGAAFPRWKPGLPDRPFANPHAGISATSPSIRCG